MDFDAGARSALPPAHCGYMVIGVDDDLTLRANQKVPWFNVNRREAFASVEDVAALSRH
jgi:hypothetical protein